MCRYGCTGVPKQAQGGLAAVAAVPPPAAWTHLDGLQRRGLAGTVARHASQCVLSMLRPQTTPGALDMISNRALAACTKLLGRWQTIGYPQGDAEC